MSSDASLVQDDSPLEGRRIGLPAFLFIATCLSTFWVGAVDWKPISHLGSFKAAILIFFQNLPQGSVTGAFKRAAAVANLNMAQGLTYMAAVLGILLTHEMGHFLLTCGTGSPPVCPTSFPCPSSPSARLAR